MQKFNRNKVVFGDRLIVKRAPSVPAWFKFIGHKGEVIITYQMPDGEMRDAIVLQRELSIPDLIIR